MITNQLFKKNHYQRKIYDGYSLTSGTVNPKPNSRTSDTFSMEIPKNALVHILAGYSTVHCKWIVGR